MSRARDYRKTKDGRCEDRFAARRRRFRPAMELLGVAELFADTPRAFQEAIWRCKGPEPTVVAGEDVDPIVPAGVRSVIGQAGIEIEGHAGRKARLTFPDLYAVLMPLWATLRSIGTAGILPSVLRLNERALPFLDRISKVDSAKLSEALGPQIDAVTLWYSRTGGRGYGWDIEPLVPNGEQPAMRIRIHAVAPETRQFRVDGVHRPAHRVGCTRSVLGFDWVSCPASAFGGAEGDQPLPVYAQSHALRQLHDRLNLPGLLPWTEYFLAASMVQPVCARRLNDDDVLLEYRLQDHKAGYLVARRVEGCVLVRTFLFLTMAGTPEGDRLERRLRITRDEAAWLGLNKLSAFGMSDLRNDADLCAILDRCGCAHLVEIGRGVPLYAASPGLAAEVRKYIGMAPPPPSPTADDASDDVTPARATAA